MNMGSYEQRETKNLALLSETGGKLFDNIKAFVVAIEVPCDLLASLGEAAMVLGRQVAQGALEVTFLKVQKVSLQKEQVEH